MPAVPIIAAASLAVAAVGTVGTLSNQKKMINQQKKAAKFERQKAQLVETRQKIEAVRQTRTALANATQTAENQGVAGSSAAQGGQGSIISQGMSNLSFLDQYGFLSDQAGNALQKAMGYQAKGALWQGVSEIGFKAFGMAGGFGGGGSGGGGGASAAGASGGSLGGSGSFRGTPFFPPGS